MKKYVQDLEQNTRSKARLPCGSSALRASDPQGKRAFGALDYGFWAKKNDPPTVTLEVTLGWVRVMGCDLGWVNVFPGVSRHAEFDFDIHFARGSLYTWCSAHRVNFTGVTLG